MGRHFLTAGLAVVIALSITLFIANRIEQETATVVKNKQLAASLGKRTEFLARLNYYAEVIGNNDERIEHAFPPVNALADFNEALNDIARKSSVTQSLHIAPPANSSFTAPFPLFAVSYTNTISGNIISFQRYLQAFENLPYFTKIENINISSSGKWEDSATMSYGASLQTSSPQ